MSQASLDAPVTDSLKSLAVDIVDIKHVYPPRRPSRKAKQQQVSTEPITALKSLSLQVNESEIFGIQLAIAWIPSVLIVIAFYFIYLLPIDSRRHAIIRRRLSHQKFAVGA